MGGMRNLKRQIQRKQGELPMKKVIARKMGISLDELNDRFFREGKKYGRRKETGKSSGYRGGAGDECSE